MGALHPSVRKQNRSNFTSSPGSPAAVSNNPAPDKSNGVRSLRPDEAARRILKILKIVQSKQPLRVSEVALEAHLSPSHLQHLFKQETGVSLGHLLTEQRLQRAVHLLVRSDMRIKEIASFVGYEHAPSFIRAFERRFGQSPHSYRLRRGAKC